jgi:hypothetical protein
MRDDQIVDLEERLTKMMRRILDQPEAARHGILVELEKARLSITDLYVVIAGSDSPLHMLAQENRELRAQLHLLAGGAGLTWQSFIGACEKVVDTVDPRWRNTIAPHLGCSVADLQGFQRNNRVPMSVLKQLEQVPDLRGSASDRDPRVREILNHIRDLEGLVRQLHPEPK